LRTRWFVLALAAIFFGALAGILIAPQPTVAVSREMIELQEQVTQILQTQQTLRSAIDTNHAELRTLVQQSLDSVNKLSGEMDAVQKSMQEVQANTGARMDAMTQQSQGVSDNVQDIQARVGKLSQQLTDTQNLLQSIDAKVSGGAGAPTVAGVPAGAAAPSAADSALGAAPAGNAPDASEPPISADTLYQNGLRDYSAGKYDLASQEFSDYIKFFPSNDLASNSQFYLGEIAYQQGDFKGAIGAYDVVITTYPKSFKQAAALLKKGLAELELGLKASATRDLREVVHRYPGTDEARRAEARLREMGTASPSKSPARH
jgi:tol-pal system protein YbgF